MNALIITGQDNQLSTVLDIGQAANEAASKMSFADYRSRKAANTLARHDCDLALFVEYLAAIGIESGNLAMESELWSVITWGLVEGFVKWQLTKGFAVSSVNVRLSTVKTYAKLAVKAGTLDKSEYAMIRTISGYSRKEGKRIDEQREKVNLPTRIDRPGAKAAVPVVLTDEQVTQLKRAAANSPQAARDNLLMSLLLDHGLRASEVAILKVSDFNLNAGKFEFYRPKVDKTQAHRMTVETLHAARRYWQYIQDEDGPLLRESKRGGRLSKAGMSTRAITKRVKTLGETIGIGGLSAHDCRHYAATHYGKTKTTKQLMEIFGWNSPAMAMRYQRAAEIISIE